MSSKHDKYTLLVSPSGRALVAASTPRHARDYVTFGYRLASRRDVLTLRKVTEVDGRTGTCHCPKCSAD